MQLFVVTRSSKKVRNAIVVLQKIAQRIAAVLLVKSLCAGNQQIPEGHLCSRNYLAKYILVVGHLRNQQAIEKIPQLISLSLQ